MYMVRPFSFLVQDLKHLNDLFVSVFMCRKVDLY